MFALVFTTYNPDGNFVSKCKDLIQFCDLIIISDNTPGGFEFGDLPDAVICVKNMENLGLGPAINVALRVAVAHEVDVVTIFDQDSSPSGDLLKGLKGTLAELQNSSRDFLCLGPTHVDDKAGVIPRDHTGTFSSDENLKEVTCLPTSGITFKLEKLLEANMFSADFFLDFADFDWCWRIRASGGKCFRSRNLFMLHRLGEGERKIFGVKFYIPVPFRHYFQFRDTLWLCCAKDVPIYSKVRLVCVLPLKLILYPIILDSGYERLCWMFTGIRDFFFGIRGVGAARRLIS